MEGGLYYQVSSTVLVFMNYGGIALMWKGACNIRSVVQYSTGIHKLWWYCTHVDGGEAIFVKPFYKARAVFNEKVWLELKGLQIGVQTLLWQLSRHVALS